MPPRVSTTATTTSPPATVVNAPWRNDYPGSGVSCGASAPRRSGSSDVGSRGAQEAARPGRGPQRTSGRRLRLARGATAFRAGTSAGATAATPRPGAPATGPPADETDQV